MMVVYQRWRPMCEPTRCQHRMWARRYDVCGHFESVPCAEPPTLAWFPRIPSTLSKLHASFVRAVRYSRVAWNGVVTGLTGSGYGADGTAFMRQAGSHNMVTNGRPLCVVPVPCLVTEVKRPPRFGVESASLTMSFDGVETHACGLQPG